MINNVKNNTTGNNVAVNAAKRAAFDVALAAYNAYMAVIKETGNRFGVDPLKIDAAVRAKYFGTPTQAKPAQSAPVQEAPVYTVPASVSPVTEPASGEIVDAAYAEKNTTCVSFSMDNYIQGILQVSAKHPGIVCIDSVNDENVYIFQGLIEGFIEDGEPVSEVHYRLGGGDDFLKVEEFTRVFNERHSNGSIKCIRAEESGELLKAMYPSLYGSSDITDVSTPVNVDTETGEVLDSAEQTTPKTSDAARFVLNKTRHIW